MHSSITIPKDRLADFCRRYRIRRLSLFGSVLREDFGPESDIDVLVVTRDAGSSEESAHRLETRLLRRYGLRLSAKILTPKELGRKRDAPFIRTARREGVVIAGKSLDEVMGIGD